MTSNIIPEKLLLSAGDTSRMLSICDKTLWSMTAPRGPIPVVKIGSRVLYSVSALQKWIDAQVAEGVSEHE
jgi:hypothetical protein